MRIAYNIKDRELITLKEDYEKLYGAYYSYEKKILKLLEGNENVFWSEDSGAYIVNRKEDFLFAFYKKPRMEGEYFLWPFVLDSFELEGGYSYSHSALNDYCFRVDTLKPHQFILLDKLENMNWVTLAPKKLDIGIPDNDKSIFEIDIP